MEERKARKEKRKAEKGEQQRATSEKLAARAKANLNDANRPLEKGDSVRIKGTNSVGEIESIQGKQATVVFGGLRSKVKLEQLERAAKPKETSNPADKHAHLAIQTSHVTRATMEDRRQNFHQDLDGVLRQLIRQYLHTVPNVKSAKDEHVQFGGAGITVVDLD